MPLVVVVVVVLVAGLVWRARTTRRLTVEESVDRYRRTLSAVHEAAAHARPAGEDPVRTRSPPRSKRSRLASPRPGRAAVLGSRRGLALAMMTIMTVAVVGIAIAASRDPHRRHASGSTTTRPPSTEATTTTRPAPTTTVPLVRPTAGSANAFTISKASYTVVVQATDAICWVDVRDPAGTALFSGTLAVGESQSVTASAVTLRLGNPAAVRVSIDGTTVPFSLSGGGPVTLHFQGSA